MAEQVFAVAWAFSEPPEIESLWISRESAEKHIRELPEGHGWDVVPMVVQPDRMCREAAALRLLSALAVAFITAAFVEHYGRWTGLAMAVAFVVGVYSFVYLKTCRRISSRWRVRS